MYINVCAFTGASSPRAIQLSITFTLLSSQAISQAEAGRVDARTVLTVLTHDPKFDVPAMRVALVAPVGYIGAMGSRRTHEDRIRRLLDAGVTAAELERLSSPVGLDLGERLGRA